MRIMVDPPKRLANLDKHGLDQAALDIAFFEGSRIVPAKQERLMAIGRFQGRAITVVFKPVGTEALSVISMRPASPKERRLLK